MASRLGNIAVGTVLHLQESGVYKDYLVVNQGLPSSMYDSSCNGTWMLRQASIEGRAWDSGNSNILESSDIKTWLNGTMLGKFDPDIQSFIKQAKIPYRQNGGTGADRSGANGLSCKIFLLSCREVGFDDSMSSAFPLDGAKLYYFASGSSSSANGKESLP